jgi:hypothetical protein
MPHAENAHPDAAHSTAILGPCKDLSIRKEQLAARRVSKTSDAAIVPPCPPSPRIRRYG